MKANDSVNVVRVLAALGTGFDCASKQEIAIVRGCGVPGSRIIFAHPTKPAHHVIYARANGVDTMTFDNAVELHKIKQMAPNAKYIIYFCINPTNLNEVRDEFNCNMLRPLDWLCEFVVTPLRRFPRWVKNLVAVQS